MLKKQTKQRKFFMIVSLGCFIWAISKYYQGAKNISLVAILIGVGLTCIEFQFPKLAQYLFEIWMRVGQWLGKINTTVLLTVIYFLIMVPLSFFFLRKRSKQSSQNYRENKSSWVELQTGFSQKRYLSPF